MVLVKYQTLNSKSDNLCFEVVFLFFLNFSRLTAVKHAGALKVSSLRSLVPRPEDEAGIWGGSEDLTWRK